MIELHWRPADDGWARLNVAQPITFLQVIEGGFGTRRRLGCGDIERLAGMSAAWSTALGYDTTIQTPFHVLIEAIETHGFIVLRSEA